MCLSLPTVWKQSFPANCLLVLYITDISTHCQPRHSYDPKSLSENSLCCSQLLSMGVVGEMWVLTCYSQTDFPDKTQSDWLRWDRFLRLLKSTSWRQPSAEDTNLYLRQALTSTAVCHCLILDLLLDGSLHVHCFLGLQLPAPTGLSATTRVFAAKCPNGG